jgi:hypothetical protein
MCLQHDILLLKYRGIEMDGSMNKSFGLFYFKLGLLLFWGVWFALAFLSNVFDLCHANGLLIHIPFHSGNYTALKNVLSIYHTPILFLNILFYLDIIIEFMISFLFLQASYSFFTNKFNYWKFVNLAFIISIALWGVFVIMEEIFLAYSFESTHIRLGMLEMISLFIFHLMPTNNDVKYS